jgi:metal-responsive CopG/Arc/MetJ family transcriptional regulator
MTTVQISLPEEQLERIEARARDLGFNSSNAYIQSLIEDDLIEQDDKLIDPVESFRQAWREMRSGQGLTEEEFWKALREDD